LTSIRISWLFYISSKFIPGKISFEFSFENSALV